MKNLKISVFSFCILALSCCGISFSFLNDKSENPADSRIKSVDLYISRATHSRTEFEQYKVSNQRIFNECGKVFGGRQQSELQNLSQLDEVNSKEINSMAAEIIAFNTEHELNLDEPGTSTSMFDPGQFILKIQRTSETTVLKTSLDSVVGESKTSVELLKKLGKKLREIALTNSNQALCGNRRFHEL